MNGQSMQNMQGPWNMPQMQSWNPYAQTPWQPQQAQQQWTGYGGWRSQEMAGLGSFLNDLRASLQPQNTPATTPAATTTPTTTPTTPAASTPSAPLEPWQRAYYGDI